MAMLSLYSSSFTMPLLPKNEQRRRQQHARTRRGQQNKSSSLENTTGPSVSSSVYSYYYYHDSFIRLLVLFGFFCTAGTILPPPLLVEAFSTTTTTTSVGRSPRRRRPTFSATSCAAAASASTAYLDSLSYQSPALDMDKLVGATSNYLEALSSVSLSSTTTTMEELLVHGNKDDGLIQQVTEEFATVLDTWTTGIESSTTVLSAQTMTTTPYLWELDTVKSHGHIVKDTVAAETAYHAPPFLEELSKNFETTIASTSQEIQQLISQLAVTTSQTGTSLTASSSSIRHSATDTLTIGLAALAHSTTAVRQAVTDIVGTTTASVSSSATQAAAVVAAAAGTTTTAAAKSGTAATVGHISAVAYAGTQGFDATVQGLLEMITATIVALPRTVLDTTNPNGINALLTDLQTGLYHDLLLPLTTPKQTLITASTTGTTTPFEQARAVVETLQLILALVVGIPRAVLEGITGETITELQADLSHTDFVAVVQQVTAVAVTLAKVIISLVTVVTNALTFLATAVVTATSGDPTTTAAVATATAAATAAAVAQQEEIIARISTFIVDKLLPAVLDGLIFVLQKFITLLIDGGAAIAAAL